MSAASASLPTPFKRALVFSLLLHVFVFVFVVASPRLSRPPQKGQIYYVNFIGGGGGGGAAGSGGSTTTVVDKPQPIPAPTKRESLRDLTVAEKVQPKTESTMRYPVDKPKREKPVTEKKAAISKPDPDKTAAASAGQGPGYSLKFGTGEGAGGGTGGGIGGGVGGGGDPFGISGFPFTWYLSILSDKVTANWFKSLVDPGVSGTYQTQVYFRIYRNGQVSDLRVEASSGIQALDLSALRAIQESSPFPALPSEYDGQYLGLHLIFEHSK
jgi:TonB family protein